MSSSSMMTSNAAIATALAKGFPPKVLMKNQNWDMLACMEQFMIVRTSKY